MMDRSKFNKYWKETEVIRQYQRMLFTFGDMQLSYILAAEHPSRKDRTVIMEGVVLIQKPTIIVPSHMLEEGPQFRNGFQGKIPDNITSLFRKFGFPYCFVHNKPLREEKVEYGGLNDVLGRYFERLEREEDIETGLIKGTVKGAEISLARYLFELIVQSTPGNVQEFMEHLRGQRGEPIRPGDHLTNEEIDLLFE